MGIGALVLPRKLGKATEGKKHLECIFKIRKCVRLKKKMGAAWGKGTEAKTPQKYETTE